MKKLHSFLSVLMTLVLACTAFAAFAVTPAVNASAASAVSLSATRYRYPICRFENANYVTGKAVDDVSATSAYLLTSAAKKNGNTANDLIYARVENYNMFNMKLGNNRALVVTASDKTSPSVQEDYTGYQFHFGSKVGTREDILPKSIQGIPANATDHGVMFHVEFSGLPGKEADGFCNATVDANDATKITGKSTHVARDINCTFQEWDYKANGEVKKKAGKVVTTAMNVKAGAKVTLIWTKNVSWTNPDEGKDVNESKYTQQKREANGKPVKQTVDGKQVDVYENIPSYNHKAGDVQLWETYTYEFNGDKLSGGTIQLPRDFCGYVIIPFSEFQIAWSGANYDNMLNFKKMELANLYFGSYWTNQGVTTIDEYCFYGPTFAKVNGAYDYGNITFANHKDSLINRKEIVIKQESTVSSKPVSVPTVIKTAVTLTNKKTGIKLEAPTTAKITSSVVLNVDEVKTTDSDYMKQLLDGQFGADTTQYKGYNVYLGADGDQEPEDFVQLDFPVPAGFDAAKCAVYTLDDDGKKVLVASTLSADKKTISVKTMSLGQFFITQDGGAAAETSSEESAELSAESASEIASVEESSAAEQKTGANLTWLWIVLAVVVVAGAGVAVFFILKNKKKADDGDDADADSSDDADNSDDTSDDAPQA